MEYLQLFNAVNFLYRDNLHVLKIVYTGLYCQTYALLSCYFGQIALTLYRWGPISADILIGGRAYLLIILILGH